MIALRVRRRSISIVASMLVAAAVLAIPARTEAVSITPIGSVQGVVADGAEGLAHRSAFAPATGNSAGTTTLTIQGVVYEKTLARTSTGGNSRGFFIQNTEDTADGLPTSSDGIFVFHGSATTISMAGGGTYAPTVGDEIVLSGRVSEFFNLTQLSASLQVLDVVETDVEVPPFDIDPPDNLADANRFWERHEGMRGSIRAGSLVVGARDVFGSTLDGEVWLVNGDHPVAQRSDPYARRVFRDPHPLDDVPALFDNGNGYRTVLGSLGLKAAANNNSVLIACAHVRHCRERARRWRVLLIREVPGADRRGPGTRSRCGPLNERAADAVRPRATVLHRHLQRREPLRPSK